MRKPFATEISRLGADPADELWWWFVTTGPHGSDRFTWAQTRWEAPGHVSIEHLQRIVAEQRGSIPNFDARIHAICSLALSSRSPE